MRGFSDDSLADSLWVIAQHMGIPCVVTQDSHYCDEKEKDTHDALKRLVAFGPDSDDAVFPGDGFHLADEVWLERHHHNARLSAGREALADIVASHSLAPCNTCYRQFRTSKTELIGIDRFRNQ